MVDGMRAPGVVIGDVRDTATDGTEFLQVEKE
jgi:hypothetical protein